MLSVVAERRERERERERGREGGRERNKRYKIISRVPTGLLPHAIHAQSQGKVIKLN